MHQQLLTYGKELPDIPLDMIGWYEGDRGITLNGSDVSIWGDQSGNGYHMIASITSREPAYNSTGLNGMGTLDFTGAKALGTPALIWPSEEVAVFSVVKNNQFPEPLQQYYFWKQGGGNTRQFRIHKDGNETNVRIDTSADGVNVTSVQGPDVNHTLFKVRTFLISPSTNQTKFRVDTVQKFQGTNTDIFDHLGGFSIPGSVSTGLEGEYAAFIIYDYIPSGANITKIETYLKNKWAV